MPLDSRTTEPEPEGAALVPAAAAGPDSMRAWARELGSQRRDSQRRIGRDGIGPREDRGMDGARSRTEQASNGDAAENSAQPHSSCTAHRCRLSKVGMAEHSSNRAAVTPIGYHGPLEPDLARTDPEASRDQKRSRRFYGLSARRLGDDEITSVKAHGIAESSDEVIVARGRCAGRPCPGCSTAAMPRMRLASSPMSVNIRASCRLAGAEERPAEGYPPGGSESSRCSIRYRWPGRRVHGTRMHPRCPTFARRHTRDGSIGLPRCGPLSGDSGATKPAGETLTCRERVRGSGPSDCCHGSSAPAAGSSGHPGGSVTDRRPGIRSLHVPLKRSTTVVPPAVAVAAPMTIGQ